MADKFGYITQVIGPVVDVTFEGEGNDVPPIYAALKIERENGSDLIVEVEQHIGENTVRCVAMDSTGRSCTRYESNRLATALVNAYGLTVKRAFDECVGRDDRPPSCSGLYRIEIDTPGGSGF